MMEPTTEEILHDIYKKNIAIAPDIPPVTTSAKHYRNWVNPRIRPIGQILINAITASNDNYIDIQKEITYQLKEELKPYASCHILPYPFNSVDQMNAVILELAAHFGIELPLNEIIKSFDEHPDKGYLIITLISCGYYIS